MKLKDKVAIITGAARGIGEKTAKLFAEHGAKVVVADYDEIPGRETRDEIQSEGGEACFVKVDVSDFEDAQNMIDVAQEEYGSIDILINNAGITADGFLTKMSEEDWDRVIDVNLKGTFNCSKFAAQKMMEQEDGGVIINASSVVGLHGNIGQTNYAASKFGVKGLTKTWAKELGGRGIRVNCVAPGYTNTRMMDDVPEKVLDSIRDKNSLGRLGESEEIAYAYLYLASEEASYVNGAILPVDGGQIL